MIAADPQQFEQMLINLLTNAFDASPDGAFIDVIADVESAPVDRLRLGIDLSTLYRRLKEES